MEGQMCGVTRIPVVGVFYNESSHLHDWLASIEEQRDAEIEPIPVIVVSRHPRHVAELEAILNQCVRDNRLRAENFRILDRNVGHTVALNLGFKPFLQEDGEWPWIASLDPDARLAPGALRQLRVAGDQNFHVGMVSPIVIKPRADGNFRRPVAKVESVCHAGHFPFASRRPSSGLINSWHFHFKNWKVADVQAVLHHHPESAPFAACFCASLWNSRMLRSIGPPDPLQFRTLNCGEIGYRAQLNGWSGRFASNAFAFHPNAPDSDYASDRAIEESGCTAWHYYHAQGLIALKYFPDDLRNIAARCYDIPVAWEYYFPDLTGVEAQMDNAARHAVFVRWREFDLSR